MIQLLMAHTILGDCGADDVDVCGLRVGERVVAIVAVAVVGVAVAAWAIACFLRIAITAGLNALIKSSPADQEIATGETCSNGGGSDRRTWRNSMWSFDIASKLSPGVPAGECKNAMPVHMSL